ncbi:MAG: carboxypeptidase regulatory-like domain-containing protein [Desulfobacterales bacterium]|nr:carboxypeptidase regulatory-like domain-containing protein [Desulfobacterales bacterium]
MKKFILHLVLLLSLIIAGCNLSGTITYNQNGLEGVAVTLRCSDGVTKTAVTDSNGKYSFSDVTKGSYTIAASKLGYSFYPESINMDINKDGAKDVDFEANTIALIPFKPSLHGFCFTNYFTGYPLPFLIPGLPDIPQIPDTYGLCGGMSFSVYDYYIANKTIPSTSGEWDIPEQGTPLHQYIYWRQINSFGKKGEFISKFAKWMDMPDGTSVGTQKKTYDEFEEIRSLLDAGNLVPLGLVKVKTGAMLWKNHQVLAYGYVAISDDLIHIKIYDPNAPLNDSIAIKAERVIVEDSVSNPIYGYKCVTIGGDYNYTIRGFFKMNYVPVVPPDGL